MKFGVPIYILVISMMIWRAWARIPVKDNYLSKPIKRHLYPNFQSQTRTWIQLTTLLGSVLFALSDFIIGIDTFVWPVAHAQVRRNCLQGFF